MTGETNLAVLLESMQPVLDDEEYVFCALTGGIDPDLDPLGAFREDEGMTLIVERGHADAAGLAYGPVLRRITLTVHSSLEAVGLIAAVAQELAGRGIAVNPVAAYHHDHLFVPAARAEEALLALEELSARA